MRASEFADEALSLRAKIDMASPNINLRDPILYRIRHAARHQTGANWCIYPTYDYTHCISDAIENITHSLCTLEFEDHRPLNWSEQAMAQSAGALKRLYTALRGLATDKSRMLVNSRYERTFNAAMDDDFNTPAAFRTLFDLAREINRQRPGNESAAAEIGRLLIRLGGVLGILQLDPEFWLQGADAQQIDAAKVESLIAARDQARADKNRQEADRIRDQLTAMNIIVEDRAGASRWRVAAKTSR